METIRKRESTRTRTLFSGHSHDGPFPATITPLFPTAKCTPMSQNPVVRTVSIPPRYLTRILAFGYHRPPPTLKLGDVQGMPPLTWSTVEALSNGLLLFCALKFLSEADPRWKEAHTARLWTKVILRGLKVKGTES